MWRISAQARPGLSEAMGPTSHFLRFRSQKQTVCLEAPLSEARGIENTLEALVREVANFLLHSSSRGEERLTAKKKAQPRSIEKNN